MVAILLVFTYAYRQKKHHITCNVMKFATVHWSFMNTILYTINYVNLIIYATSNSLFTQYHQWIQYIINNLCTSNLAKFNSLFINGAYGEHHKTDSFEGSL